MRPDDRHKKSRADLGLTSSIASLARTSKGCASPSFGARAAAFRAAAFCTRFCLSVNRRIGRGFAAAFGVSRLSLTEDARRT